MLGKKIGRRGMLLGALAQSIPDIDFVAALWNRPAANLLAHRGFTHSILFGLLMVVLFSLVAERLHRPHKVGYRRWTLFFSVEIAIHLFLDLFNNYGMGLFEPFSHARISFNTIYVADPFFSIWPAIAFAMLVILPKKHKKRTFWWRFGLAGSLLYFSYCVTNKLLIDSDTRAYLKEHGLGTDKYFTTPTPLNNLLWFIVASDSAGFRVGYRSVFDEDQNIDFTYFPKNDHLLDDLRSEPDVQMLLRFSHGFYTVEKWHDTLVFNDLRFGQVVGWQNPLGHFAFHFYLNKPDNKLVVQRGRFEGWNSGSAKLLLQRIRGKKTH